MADDLVTVRGPVDRPTIALSRLLLPEASERESAAQYALRAWRRVYSAAPRYALAGRAIVFVTRADSARVIAACLDSKEVPACAYCTHELSDAERAESMARFLASTDVVLVATGTLAQGIDIADVTLVVQIGYASDPLEWYQKMGRIRGGGLGATELGRGRFLQERLSLPCDSDDLLQTRLEGVLQLVELLATPSCLRRSIVEWLGGSLLHCAGCDACVAFDWAAPANEGFGASCGALPFELNQQCVSNAACRFLGAAGEAPQLLSSMLATAISPPEGASETPTERLLRASAAAHVAEGCMASSSTPRPRLAQGASSRCAASRSACCCRCRRRRRRKQPRPHRRISYGSLDACDCGRGCLGTSQ